MQGSWPQILLGGILGAGLWSGIGGMTAPAAQPAPPIVAVEANQVNDASPGAPPPVAEITASATPLPVVTPMAVSPSPSAPVVAAPEPETLPILRGTMVGSHTCAIFEYQGIQRVVKEGETIGPFQVGGIYLKQASLARGEQKVFVPLVPFGTSLAGSPAPSPALAKSEASTEQWVKSLAITQVVREGSAVGLLIRRAGNTSVNGTDGPLSQYGVYDGDVVKAVNGHPLVSEADLWWLHEELQHAPQLEIALERSGVDQTLRQSR